MIKHPNYPRGNIYLSGGIEKAVNYGAEWRKKVAFILKEQGYFPIDITALDKAYSDTHGKLYTDFNEADELLRKANIRKHFVFTDLQLIKNDTDALILFYDESARHGAGTISEAQYAYLHDIPIFIVSYWENWQKEVPGWLHALSTKIFTKFDDCLEYMSNLPDGILKRDVYGNHHGSGDSYLCSLSGDVFKKDKHHFVSKVSPLYSSESVKIVKEVHEEMKDRYQFITEYLEDEAAQEMAAELLNTTAEELLKVTDDDLLDQLGR